MIFVKTIFTMFCVGALALVGCAAAVDEPAPSDEPVESTSDELQQPALCVDTFTCGGCCGSQSTVNRFMRCCDRGGGFACAQRFGCM